jgi:hypothetical protein
VWSCLPLTRTRRKLLTCSFATPRLSPVLCVGPRPNLNRLGSLRDRLNECAIVHLITAYRDTAAPLESIASYAPPVLPDPTHSTSYEGTSGRDASLAAHARRSPRAQRHERILDGVIETTARQRSYETER